jgi:hypothetical protein
MFWGTYIINDGGGQVEAYEVCRTIISACGPGLLLRRRRSRSSVPAATTSPRSSVTRPTGGRCPGRVRSQGSGSPILVAYRADPNKARILVRPTGEE